MSEGSGFAQAKPTIVGPNTLARLAVGILLDSLCDATLETHKDV